MKPNFFQRIVFSYATPIIRLGRQRALAPEDAPPLPEGFDPQHAGVAFDKVSTERFGRFLWQVLAATGAARRNTAIAMLAHLAFLLATPMLLAEFLSVLALNSTGNNARLYLLAISLGLSGLISSIAIQHFYYNALRGFATIVNGVNKRVVTQALHLRHSARSTMLTGDLVNHLSSDTDAVAESAFFIPEMISAALRTVFGIALLWQFLGLATLASVATLSILTPIAIAVARRYRRLDTILMETRDRRVTLMSQILQGIRVVKFQAWEDSARDEVATVRRREISTRKRIVATDAVSTALFISVTTLVAFAGFGTFVLMDGTLTAATVFACIALFSTLEEPFGMISHHLANVQHARVATERLNNFFLAGSRNIGVQPLSAQNHPVGVEATNVSLHFDHHSSATLRNCTVTITPGSSVAIVGSVGAGKSTLLRTLAGLHQVSSGCVEYTNINSSTHPLSAYVPQDAFILNASVVDNIRFGSEHSVDGRGLGEIVRQCALDPDVQSMPNNLNTQIGERGVNLSGGQKQRISLARAAYINPGIVFLDDPLSAVDFSTENHIVNELLFGRWQHITRVMVTHRLAHLGLFDKVVVLEQGCVVASGTLEQVRHALPAEAISSVGIHPPQHELAESTQGSKVLKPERIALETASPEDGSSHDHFTSVEEREVGSVGKRVYRAYLNAVLGTNPVSATVIGVGLVGSAILITVLPMAQMWWLGRWTDSATQPDAMSALGAVAVFGALGVAVLLGWIVERLLWLWRAAVAGQVLHDSALAGILHAPVSFFDTTPIGRVLNRFAKDQEAVDDQLSWNFEQSFKSLAQTVGSLVMVLAVLPLAVVIIVPVLAGYYWLQDSYRRSAREAKRLESIARSPRYAHFKELVTGLDVIHGFCREQWFYSSFMEILSQYQRTYYCSILLNRWFSVRVPLVSSAVSLASCLGIAYLSGNNAITTGLAGLVLTYALNFWGNLNWTVRAFSEVESRMTSVERLGHYGALTPEPQVTTIDSSGTQVVLPSDVEWPTAGHIEIVNLSVRYASNLPLALNRVSFEVPAGKKAGIVGRTGSGKSTLFQSLFRFVESESGSIKIDGVDIRTIPLQRLRRALAIIPQDPTLFIGTVRSNLDRFSQCSDEQVLTALKRVHLSRYIQSLPHGLESQVLEGGANFSQGQRQLLCLARALLAGAKIIVLDEATASVDAHTDMLIQHTIRTEFAHATVLTIAHRLGTVADADMIIELRNGSVVRRS